MFFLSAITLNHKMNDIINKSLLAGNKFMPEMRLRQVSKFNEGFRFLLCVIDIFIKYTWVLPLKDKKRCE